MNQRPGPSPRMKLAVCIAALGASWVLVFAAAVALWG